MPALMVDTSAHPRAICYKCYDGSIFPHHKETTSRDVSSPSSLLRLEGLAQARMTLAQASSPSPRRELDEENSSPCAISLRRDPLRLSETLTRSKRTAGRLGDHSWKISLGEPLLTSSRRDQVAWASLSLSATVLTCSRLVSVPQTTFLPYHTPITVGKLKQSQPTSNNRLVPNKQEGSSFPYLERD
ncbi:hypothetical protein DEO72_LG2g4711 [Vigna unguiculata]|uniref:Uncharacterized protein n=1 Tax=Vigna unguiculata TaxID=3917 RepID=A0A4D6L765_VIGUN|nr:hypothetical protein DEO72_LG2g4711 [Vigna unguiculata]